VAAFKARTERAFPFAIDIVETEAPPVLAEPDRTIKTACARDNHAVYGAKSPPQSATKQHETTSNFKGASP
jgi:hypothetical protein